MLVNKLHKPVTHHLIAMLDVVQFKRCATPAMKERVKSHTLLHLEVMDARTEECANALISFRVLWTHQEKISVRCIDKDIVCIHGCHLRGIVTTWGMPIGLQPLLVKLVYKDAALLVSITRLRCVTTG